MGKAMDLGQPYHLTNNAKSCINILLSKLHEAGYLKYPRTTLFGFKIKTFTRQGISKQELKYTVYQARTLFCYMTWPDKRKTFIISLLIFLFSFKSYELQFFYIMFTQSSKIGLINAPGWLNFLGINIFRLWIWIADMHHRSRTFLFSQDSSCSKTTQWSASFIMLITQI